MKHFIFILSITISSWCFGQQASKYLNVYRVNSAADLSNLNEEELAYANFYKTNGWTIAEQVPVEKLNKLPLVAELDTTYSTWSKSDFESMFNILRHPSTRDSRFARIYRINNTQQVLILLAPYEVEHAFENSTK